MESLKGVEYLRRKLEEKRPRVLTRYRYYDMKNRVKYFSRMLPAEYKWMSHTLGWCSKAVDSLADRLVFNKFREDDFNLNQIFQMNNSDILFDAAVLAALIGSCCFVYISPDADGFPRLQVIDGSNATGIIDPITGLLKEGYAVLQRGDYGLPTVEAYFTPDSTQIYEGGKPIRRVPNPAPAPLLVPIIYRPDATRPFGHSRISRACMSIMQSALRTIKRSEISAEFYSFPQRYVLGLSEDTEFDGKSATLSTYLAFTKDEDGDSPSMGQFTQQSMSPYTEQLRTFAALFAGETGLSLDDLGFVSDNPSSAEAIKASHDILRLTARKAQRTFGSGLLNAGYLSACLRDNFPYKRRQIYFTRPVWRPIFEPDSATLSSVGDSLLKLNQAYPDYISRETLEDLLGF